MAVAVVILTRSSADPRMKARLSPVLTKLDDRREVALAFLDDLMARVTALPDVFLKVAVTPPIEGIRMSRPSILWNQLLPQRGATFGDRLQHCIDDLAAAGFAQIVLMGADVPDLPSDCIAEALGVIRGQTSSVVTGPSGDGSFYLFGLTVQSGRVPQLFENVRWGTPDMLSDVESNARAQGLTVHRVANWRDVDTPDDLSALVERLQADPTAAPATASVLRRIGLISDPTASSQSPR